MSTTNYPSEKTSSHSPDGGSMEDRKNGAAADAIMASEHMDDRTKQNAIRGLNGPPPFRIQSLWEQPVINPLNLKSYTLPIFNLNNPYSRNFHLSWLGFFVAFLSWFAFPPLVPEAIRADLGLTAAQVGNSNIVALCATLVVRLIIGPLVDRFGPRRVMASLLVLGAIPSGLAGVAHDAGSLYTLRFFIGILGGTFVPCQAWTTAFFDKNVVGTANALVGGWGNMGGGVTFVVMIGLYNSLLSDGLSQHSAWRAAFAIVPVPILLFVAILTLVFGTDHPAGKWSQRHTTPATALAVAHGHRAVLDQGEKVVIENKARGKGEEANVAVQEATDEELEKNYKSEVDVAVNEALTFKSAGKILSSPLTWLPGLAYFTTFGYELAIDSNLATVLFGVYSTKFKVAGFGQTKAGYYTSIFGFLNFATRPIGGWLGDRLYRSFGTNGKKYSCLISGFISGVFSLALGLWLEHHINRNIEPDLATFMGLVSGIAIFNEAANGINFSLVPHVASYNNGVISGLVGSMGNLGGIFLGLVFRFQPAPAGKAFWICGIVIMAVNVLCLAIKVPKY